MFVALGAAERPSARADEPKAISTEKYIERAAGRLIVPVRGLRSADLSDTWGAARSNGRRHEGIDIMAPHGAPVLAAADGEIVRFWNSELGGITLYQADETGEVVYYYAHLSSYAEGLKQGDRVRQGDVIGYVGATGNATTPHLHFEIQRTSNARRWWHGTAINPYPYLASGDAPNEPVRSAGF
ncbi:MAG TPA: M23 family metallopeptidase [Candidatus Binatia bacterium]|nr:M23 family metallopeptidase [Candidatus Binatia bacterium]